MLVRLWHRRRGVSRAPLLEGRERAGARAIAEELASESASGDPRRGRREEGSAAIQAGTIVARDAHQREDGSRQSRRPQKAAWWTPGENSIINGMFENIEDVRMSESFHSKDKMIGKVFEHF